VLLRIHPDNPDERNLRTVVECLQDGGIVVYPTDTIYGIGCDIFKTRSVEKIYKLKGVDSNKANFSLVCCDLSQISYFTRHIETPVYKAMKKALPGPFTFILEAGREVPKLFLSRKKTVGIRVPDNYICREIVRMLGHPIVSTSVHDSDEVLEYTTDPELIHERYGNRVDLVIDGGFGGNVPSTVIDCSNGDMTLIRAGKGDPDLIL
jgi:tRNA threonylcarbamoyl adenosine modification protein (Sua5/YciO/YrdC/YwlC family)